MTAATKPLTAEEIERLRERVRTARRWRYDDELLMPAEEVLRLCDAAESASAKDAEIAALLQRRDTLQTLLADAKDDRDGWKRKLQCQHEQATLVLDQRDAAQKRAEQAGADAAVLHAALVEARDSIESWAGYASEYFREKHDLAGELARLDAVIAAGQASDGESHD